MVQITAIIEDDILEKVDIEASKNRISRSKEIATCIRAYFEPNVNEAENIALKGEIESINKILEIKENQIKDFRDQNNELTRMLNQEQVLHLQTQKLLPERLEVQNKSSLWWQFWKK